MVSSTFRKREIMEEIKKNQTDGVIEQRPSKKYGRTAYQEQLRREQQKNEQEAAGKENGTMPQQEFYQTQQMESNGWQNSYAQNRYQMEAKQSNPVSEEAKAAVKNTFCYILMALMAASSLIMFFMSGFVLDGFIELGALDIEGLFELLGDSGLYVVLSYLGDMLMWLIVIFLILDIIGLHKANYRITGAILFALFLRPLYFIWRAHLLGKKKMGGILYALCYYGFCILQYALLAGKMAEFASLFLGI